MPKTPNDKKEDVLYQGRDKYFMDVDRMVNEGQANSVISMKTESLGATTTDTMDNVESVKSEIESTDNQ